MLSGHDVNWFDDDLHDRSCKFSPSHTKTLVGLEESGALV